MARRLPGDAAGGEVEIRINDAKLRAFDDESIAAASLASRAGMVMARSLKYHRPRSFFCMEGHCSGCLVRIDGVPNLRACQTPCRAGTEVVGQNAFPSTEIDLLGAVDFLFSRGMDHHTLMTGSSVLNKLANKVVRQLSGLGKLPTSAASELPTVGRYDVDVCVIGGGPAGMAAATAAALGGRTTLIVDDQLALGGSMRADPRCGRAVADEAYRALRAAHVAVLARSTAIGYFPEDGDAKGALAPFASDASALNGVLAVASPERLYRVYAKRWIWATGGYATNLPFADNDRPGVLAARAVGRLLVEHRIVAGDKIVVVEVPEVKAETDALCEALAAVGGVELQRVPLEHALGTRGRGWVSGFDAKDHRHECDIVAVAAIPAPASEGARQQGCKVVLDPPRGGFRIVVDEAGRTSVPGVYAVGDVTGFVGPLAARAEGTRIGTLCAQEQT